MVLVTPLPLTASFPPQQNAVISGGDINHIWSGYGPSWFVTICVWMSVSQEK